MRLFSQTLRGQSIVGSDSCGGDRRYLAYLVVYPAEYGNSGVMTFMVNQDGKILQKDLGKDTLQIAAKIKTYDPDAGWKPAAP